MNQVHKETLASVDNSLPNRQGLEVEIFGMEGIPAEVAQAHNQRIIAGFYQAEAERRAATGNPTPGGAANPVGGQPKKPKFESPAELKKRLAEHKARKAQQAVGGGSSGGNTPMDNSPMGQSPGAFVRTHKTPFIYYTNQLFKECVAVPSSTSHFWRITRCGIWIIHSRAVYTTCGSLSAVLSSTTSIFWASRCSISTTVFSPAAVLCFAIVPSRIPTKSKFPWSTVWSRIGP